MTSSCPTAPAAASPSPSGGSRTRSSRTPGRSTRTFRFESAAGRRLTRPPRRATIRTAVGRCRANGRSAARREDGRTRDGGRPPAGGRQPARGSLVARRGWALRPRLWARADRRRRGARGRRAPPLLRPAPSGTRRRPRGPVRALPRAEPPRRRHRRLHARPRRRVGRDRALARPAVVAGPAGPVRDAARQLHPHRTPAADGAGAGRRRRRGRGSARTPARAAGERSRHAAEHAVARLRDTPPCRFAASTHPPSSPPGPAASRRDGAPATARAWTPSVGKARCRAAPRPPPGPARPTRAASRTCTRSRARPPSPPSPARVTPSTYAALGNDLSAKLDARLAGASKAERKDMEKLLHFAWNGRGDTTSAERLTARTAVAAYLAEGGGVAGARVMRDRMLELSTNDASRVISNLKDDEEHAIDRLAKPPLFNPKAQDAPEVFQRTAAILLDFPAVPAEAGKTAIANDRVALARDQNGQLQIRN